MTEENRAVPAAARGKINSLQGIRAVAFLSIFLYHATRICPGAWGVSVFFVLSGFAMTYAYWDRVPERGVAGAARFAWRKIWRLFPLHVLMLLAAAARLYGRGKTVGELARGLALALPLIQTWSPTDYQTINSVDWYLSATLFLYFCFPFVLRAVKRLQKNGSAALWMAAAYACQLIVGYLAHRYTSLRIKWVVYCLPLYRLGDFAVGCALACVYVNRSRAPSRIGPVGATVIEIAVLALNVLACLYRLNAPKDMQWFTYTCLFVPTSAALIHVYARGEGIISRLLSNRVMLWLAGLSAHKFLIHRQVIYFVHDFIRKTLHCKSYNLVLFTAVCLAVTIALTGLYRAAERRAGAAIARVKARKA